MIASLNNNPPTVYSDTASTLTPSITVPSECTCLVVPLYWNNATSLDSVVWDSAGVNESLTIIEVAAFENVTRSVIAYLFNPTAKTATLTCTWTGTANTDAAPCFIMNSATSLTDSDSIGQAGGNDDALTLDTVVDGIVLSIMSRQTDTRLTPENLTEIIDQATINSNGWGVGILTPDGTSETVGWSDPGNSHAHVAISIGPVPRRGIISSVGGNTFTLGSTNTFEIDQS